MAAGIDDDPFCFDTGATSHISPVKGDFVNLKPIAPRNIWEVNGIAIPTIGTGPSNSSVARGETLYSEMLYMHLRQCYD